MRRRRRACGDLCHVDTAAAAGRGQASGARRLDTRPKAPSADAEEDRESGEGSVGTPSPIGPISEARDLDRAPRERPNPAAWLRCSVRGTRPRDGPQQRCVGNGIKEAYRFETKAYAEFGCRSGEKPLPHGGWAPRVVLAGGGPQSPRGVSSPGMLRCRARRRAAELVRVRRGADGRAALPTGLQHCARPVPGRLSLLKAGLEREKETQK